MFCLIFKLSNGSISCAISAGAQFDSHWTAVEKKQKMKKPSWGVPHIEAKPTKGVQCLPKTLTSIIQLCFDTFRTSYQALSLCHCLSHFVSHSISYLTLMLYFNAFNCSLYRSHSLTSSHNCVQLSLNWRSHSLSLYLCTISHQLTLSLTLLYLVSFLHLVFFTICVYCIYKQLCRLIIIPFIISICIYVYKNVNHKKNHKKTTYFIVSVNGRRTLTCLSRSKIMFYWVLFL